MIADNVLAAGDHFGPEELLAVIEDDADAGPEARGIADYYERVLDDPEFGTALLPLGEGVMASVRVE